MKTKVPSKMIAIGILCAVLVFMLLPVRYATFGQNNYCPDLPNVECGAETREKNRPFVLKLLDNEHPAYILDLKTTSESQIIHSGTDFIKIDVVRNGILAIISTGSVIFWLLHKSLQK